MHVLQNDKIRSIREAKLITYQESFHIEFACTSNGIKICLGQDKSFFYMD